MHKFSDLAWHDHLSEHGLSSSSEEVGTAGTACCEAVPLCCESQPCHCMHAVSCYMHRSSAIHGTHAYILEQFREEEPHWLCTPPIMQGGSFICREWWQRCEFSSLPAGRSALTFVPCTKVGRRWCNHETNQRKRLLIGQAATSMQCAVGAKNIVQATWFYLN